MSKDQFLNILDFGNSSIRFSIFDKKLDNYFSEIIDLKNEKHNFYTIHKKRRKLNWQV